MATHVTAYGVVLQCDIIMRMNIAQYNILLERVW